MANIVLLILLRLVGVTYIWVFSIVWELRLFHIEVNGDHLSVLGMAELTVVYYGIPENRLLLNSSQFYYSMKTK